LADGRLRVGVIGAGWVASARHIPSFQRVPGVDVAAVLDPHLERAQKAAATYKIALACDNSEQFFSSGLDIVAVCTPPQTHAALAIDAMEHGCHVLVEKPMAMSRAEAESMIEVAGRNQRLLSVSHNLLFSRSMMKIRRMMARGELGDIRQVYGFQLSSPKRRLPVWHAELPGGLFFDEAPHLLYLMRYFLGDAAFESVSVNQRASAIKSAYAKLQGDSVEGLLSMSFEAPVSEWLLTVVGSRRVVVFDVFRDILTSLRDDGSHGGLDVLRSTMLAGVDFTRGFLTSGLLHSRKSLFYGHERLIADFVEGVRRQETPSVSGQDGLEVVSMMEKLLRSGQEG
jgi:predicted dehydrogenase